MLSDRIREYIDSAQTPTPKPTKKPKKPPTPVPTDTPTLAPTETPVPTEVAQQVNYKFRSKKLLDQHYEKHGIDMGFPDTASYVAAANEIINDPSSLHKTEKEDGDDVYYRESDNGFVVVSKDGYIRTFFYPDS